MRNGADTGESSLSEFEFFNAGEVEAAPLGDASALGAAGLLVAKDLAFAVGGAEYVGLTGARFAIVGKLDDQVIGEGSEEELIHLLFLLLGN